MVTESGKVVPYGFSAGTVDDRGKVDVWTPAARVPRDYKAAAKQVLEDARATLVECGDVKVRPRHADARFHERIQRENASSHNNFVAAYGGKRRTTEAQAREHLTDLGMSLRKKGGEYRVNFQGGAEGTAYYTDDLGDAIATGEAMALQRRKNV